MSGSLTRREIVLTVQLGKGAYGASGFDTVTLSGYRVSAVIVKAGQAGFGRAELRVWGLDASIMNQLNTLGIQFFPQGTRYNKIAISAGDAVNGMATVFTGTLYRTAIDFDAMPSVAFTMMASTAVIAAMKPVPPTSFGALVPVATVMQSLAAQMGLSLENSGVTEVISYPYLAGTARDQVAKLARAAGIQWTIDAELGVLAIWPAGLSRSGASLPAPLLSPTTGMIGYPGYTPAGISVRAVYTPGVLPAIGAPITVQSSQKQAEGTWIPMRIALQLDARVPGGLWEMQIEANGPLNAFRNIQQP